VLDIGCGIGRLEVELASRVASVHGIDVSMQMINTALRRYGELSNVHFLKVTGRDLADYASDTFDAAVAVDTFPYIKQSGAALVERYFAEVSRVLKAGCDFVILNFSYDDDDAADEAEIEALAKRHSFKIVIAGARPFSLWDGLAFHLRKQ
jgi:ubiquinone/menaquinone biosynthesis C-methylase UbiE